MSKHVLHLMIDTAMFLEAKFRGRKFRVGFTQNERVTLNDWTAYNDRYCALFYRFDNRGPIT